MLRSQAPAFRWLRSLNWMLEYSPAALGLLLVQAGCLPPVNPGPADPQTPDPVTMPQQPDGANPQPPAPAPNPNPAPAPLPPAPGPVQPAPGPVDPVPGGGTMIVESASSIRAEAGGLRSDPEGVAAPSNVTLIRWRDARGAERRMTLGAYLYQYDFTYFDGAQIVARSANDDAWGHEGFGYVVSHTSDNGNSPIGKVNTPSRVDTRVLLGGHHALHRVELIYDRDKEAGGHGIKIPVVIEWLVATGRDHPVWSVTWKMNDVVNPENIDFNAYRMDVRGPYGSLNFDGAASRNQGDAIGGVAWGDFALRFATSGQQLTMNSPWTYNTSNQVCFTRAWTANVNAEMGIVQTRLNDKEMGYPDRVGGRERGNTSADPFLNRGDCNGFGDNRVYSMPCVNGWPYQLMNYDWGQGTGKPVDEASGTKLVAWGTPYGWLGASQFDLFDGSATADGRGDRSYATFIVLGPRCRSNPGAGGCDQNGDVENTLAEVAALGQATLGGFNAGSLQTQYRRGPGAAQNKALQNGYNDTYASFHLVADDRGVDFAFVPAAARPVSKPIFVIANWSARTLPKIQIDGVEVAVNADGADRGAFVSLDTAGNELWVTVNRTLSESTRIRVAP